jgi:UDP-N-acetylmuramoylalanine--D-glutamate ligase
MVDVSALSGLRILIVGLGREGIALANYLTKHNLMVAATDLKPEAELETVAVSLRKAGVSLHLGEHNVSLLNEADIIFVSPGVPLEIPFLQQAMLRKIPLSTESRLFCHLCPAPILAVTGSSGKTTTTTLLGQIMQADGRTTWVGGNIGHPLITIVDQIGSDDIVVMEMSSFQLEYFHARLNQGVEVNMIPAANQQELARLLSNWSPPISAILNITPNHLDRHPTMKHYVRAKRAIIDYQGDEGIIIMNLDNDMTRTIGSQFGSKVRWFSLEAQMPHGAGILDDTLVLFDEAERPYPLVKKQDIRLRGAHNISNILAACLMAREAGASIKAMQNAITSFTGVAHRLEWVREHNQVSYYDDSISTSPERLVAALHTFNESVVLLVGGRDKHLPWDQAAWLMLVKTRQVILFGEAVEIILEAIEAARPQVARTDTVVHRCANLEEAVALAARVAQAGDIVLLSPGCASFDAFRDFVERGERFKELVRQL